MKYPLFYLKLQRCWLAFTPITSFAYAHGVLTCCLSATLSRLGIKVLAGGYCGLMTNTGMGEFSTTLLATDPSITLSILERL